MYQTNKKTLKRAITMLHDLELKCSTFLNSFSDKINPTNEDVEKLFEDRQKMFDLIKLTENELYKIRVDLE